MSGALMTLQRQPYGSVFLALAALGLIAFAAFEFIEAWARRIDPPPAMPAAADYRFAAENYASNRAR